ncbi:unnamed protein product [Adineta steineri]|uniref:Glyoxalase-like domain-containing protein n=1 Tax=Adineta steineri TaxID=433720 RepID=A0A815QTZ8_9BILA|nr:unnamed protein product [Adineta steineri]CAF1634947.1 unnamed protein product [Adineta steineri]
MMNHIDHIILNTRNRLDQVAAYFQRMGFIITPRGYHSVGTINHTIVFKTDYLELFGYTEDTPSEKRLRLEQLPAGLITMTIKAHDADEVQATLIARGLSTIPILDVSRPVNYNDGLTANASFRVTRLESAPVPGTGVSYCQHFNPELVWRPEWQAHPNSCVAMTKLYINVSDLHAAAQIYLRALDIDKLVDTEPNRYILHLPSFEIILTAGNTEPLGIYKLTFGVNSMDKLVAELTKGGIEYHKESEHIVADTLSHTGCVLEFESIS